MRGKKLSSHSHRLGQNRCPMIPMRLPSFLAWFNQVILFFSNKQKKHQQPKVVLISQFYSMYFLKYHDNRRYQINQLTPKNGSDIELSGKFSLFYTILMFDAIDRFCCAVSRSVQTVVAFVAGSHSFAPSISPALTVWMCCLCQLNVIAYTVACRFARQFAAAAMFPWYLNVDYSWWRFHFASVVFIINKCLSWLKFWTSWCFI